MLEQEHYELGKCYDCHSWEWLKNKRCKKCNDKQDAIGDLPDFLKNLLGKLK